ncbi:hypothetical protein HHI36_017395 [Cryptolaemus montrouzieri]|uniref:Uncharacterized protein n=1 Tax=Cryptolaemus montrouzieri TaxID=559131 RepID=A0ABD2NMX6_9CUCU
MGSYRRGKIIQKKASRKHLIELSDDSSIGDGSSSVDNIPIARLSAPRKLRPRWKVTRKPKPPRKPEVGLLRDVTIKQTLPTELNDTDGYHRQCYSSFTALMAKYRNSSLEIDYTSDSTSHSLSSSTLVDNSESTISQMKSIRIDIIFDQYFSPSIKDCERLRREELTTPVSIGPNQVRPHNFGAELKNIQFKEALVNFFIDHWDSEDMLPFIGNKNIYVSFNKCYSYKVLNNKVIKTIEESLSCEEHEEADTRIIFHVCQIDFDAEIVIRCSDSDILIILLGNMDHLNSSLKIWINMGVEIISDT